MRWNKIPAWAQKRMDQGSFLIILSEVYGARAAALAIELDTERRAKAAAAKPSQGAQPMTPPPKVQPPSPPLDAGAGGNAGTGLPPNPVPAKPAPQGGPLARPDRMPRPSPAEVSLADIEAATPRFDPRFVKFN